MAETNKGYVGGDEPDNQPENPEDITDYAPYRLQKDNVLHQIYLEEMMAKSGSSSPAVAKKKQPAADDGEMTKEEEVHQNQQRDVSMFRSRASIFKVSDEEQYKMASLHDMFEKHYHVENERRQAMYAMTGLLIMTLLIALACGLANLAFDDKGLTPAEKCSAGTFYNNQTVRCDPCGPGEYKDTEGEGLCTKCGPGLTTTAIASTSQDDCVEKCRAGHYYNSVSEMCVECGYGFYQAWEGQGQCQTCPQGQTTKVTDATSRSQCIVV